VIELIYTGGRVRINGHDGDDTFVVYELPIDRLLELYGNNGDNTYIVESSSSVLGDLAALNQGSTLIIHGSAFTHDHLIIQTSKLLLTRMFKSIVFDK
jgi:hypothetical protein